MKEEISNDIHDGPACNRRILQHVALCDAHDDDARDDHCLNDEAADASLLRKASHCSDQEASVRGYCPPSVVLEVANYGDNDADGGRFDGH